MSNLLDPAILFFVFGVFAGLVKSNLEIPTPISRFLSMYLLMALGLKGGFALAASGITSEVAVTLLLAVALAIIVPAMSLPLLRRWLNGYDAAALCATYGSVSAVTFITTIQFLENQGIAYGGHMAAAMALMESPAIIMAVVMANAVRRRDQTLHASGTPVPPVGMGKILHESFTDGTQLLLIGAMLIGWITGAAGEAAMAPFSVDLFKGMLAFFLLDMGLMAARNMGELKHTSRWLLAYALLAPLVHAAMALGLAVLFGIQMGNAALLMVLAASASYIAVPAVLRYAIPEARPSLYFGMSLGLTFPFNLMVGIPLYLSAARWALG
ncbi:Na+-dependent bicarbonate transporter superfamily [Burkholderiaceae bacterium]